MRSSSFLLSISLLAATFFTSVLAAQAADDRATSASFALSDPFIIKADWESNLLRAGDLNGDKLTDLVSLNNAKGALQVFYRKKDSERVFEKTDIMLDDPLAGCALGDLNGDKRVDLILAPQGKSLLIRYQQDDGTLATAVSVEAQAQAVQADDLDADGCADIIALNDDRVSLLYGSTNASTETVPPAIFFNGGAPGSYPFLGDMDGNGLTDILIVDKTRRGRMLMRFQSAPRVWSLETALEIKEISDLAIVKSNQKTQPACLATVQSGTNDLRLYRLESVPSAAEKLPLQSPHFLAIDPKLRSERESLLSSDIDGNGKPDVAISSPEAAEIMLYLQDEQGKLALRTVPSLAGVVSLAAIPRPDAGALLFALSDREETIGVSKWDSARGLSVPVFMSAPRKPLVMATGDLDGSGKQDLLYLSKDAKTSVLLNAYIDPTDTDVFSKKPLEKSLPMGSEEEPIALMAADLNGDKKSDLLLFGNYSPLRLLLQQPDGSFAPLAADQNVVKGAFNKTTPRQVTLTDLDGDGVSEMLIAGEKFARAYRIDKQGRLNPAEQFNGRNASANIEATAALDLDSSGSLEVVLLDSGNKCLTLYQRDAAGAFALVRNHDLKGASSSRLASMDANGDKRQDIVLYGGDTAQLMYSGGTSAQFKLLWTHEPEDKDGRYVKVNAGALLGAESGGIAQMVALEGTQHLCEFYRVDTAATLTQPQRFFRFKVFDDEGSMGRSQEDRIQAEPRYMLISDIDGDGMNDLTVLIHDNILVYRRTR